MPLSFWAAYVAAVCPDRVPAFWSSIAWERDNTPGGSFWSGETQAYRALAGLTWDHDTAHRSARTNA